MKFTDSQQRAISTFGKNLTLSAGAGSGKTTVLVRKYLKLLETNQASLADILAITFTNKAANGMRQKVRDHICQQIESGNALEQSYWQKLNNQFEMASITTIHSFGYQVLRNHPVESGINPEVKIMDEIQALLLLEETVESIIATTMQHNGNVRKLITDLRSVPATISMLIRIYQRSRSLGGEPSELATKAFAFKDKCQVDLGKTRGIFIDLLTELALQARASNSTAKFIAKWSDAPVEVWANTINEANSLNDYQINKTLEAIKAYCSRPVKDLQELTRLIYHKTEARGALVDFELNLAYFDAIPIWEAVSKLNQQIHIAYSDVKRRLRYVDYSDLEWKLLDLLEQNPSIRAHYQQKYKYVMVDEFQDTSPLQQQLIKLIAPYDKNSLFIVGDARQSIYRFRAAEVAGFIEMNREIVEGAGEKINLQENFRSHPQLIRFYNDLFRELFRNSAIIYEEVIAGRHDLEEAPLAELWCPPVEIMELNARERREWEAEILADNVIALVEDNASYSYGDIAILFRALTDIKIYERQLQKRNIPYVVVGSRGFFERQEIRDLLNLLTWLIHPQDMIALVGILRSPFFTLSDEALFNLQSQQQLTELQPMSLPSDNDEQAWAKACKDLRCWRSMLHRSSVSNTIQQALDDTNYQGVLLGSPGYGLQAVANIEKLLNMIVLLEQEGIIGRVEIYNYLKALKDSDARQGEAVISADVDNAVQIMSVHQSKGLEFKVVIVPQCERDVYHPDGQIIQYTREHGLVVRSRSWNDTPQPNSYYIRMQEYERQKEIEESYRLLYVASTRAEEKLVFSATPTKWELGKTASWFDWLINHFKIDAPPQGSLSTKLIKFNCKNILNLSINSGATEINSVNGGISLMPDVIRLPRKEIELSASALMEYIICPQLYYLHHIKKIPTFTKQMTSEKVDPILLGELIHKTCEKVSTAAQVFSTWSEVVDSSAISLGMRNVYFQQGYELLQRYAESEVLSLIEQAMIVKSEIPFTMGYQELIISGVIDKLIINERGIIIVDYKTGNYSSAAIEKYIVQMALYALVTEKNYSQFPAELLMYFLGNGKTYNLQQLKSCSDCQQVLDGHLTHYLASWYNHSYLPNRYHCQQCAYKYLCAKLN